MVKTRKHIANNAGRKAGSFTKSFAILCFALLFFGQNQLFAQVINNTGATVNLTTGVVVGLKDFENNAGTLGNDGTINLSGFYLNYGTTNGSGFYNLKGDWKDYGSFSPGNSTVTLYGTANQTIIHGSSGETFFNLTINNFGSTITQQANAGSSLGIQNDLNITAGTLSLHSSTANLFIGGKATINGALIYNGTTTKTTTIGGNLSGPGSIDMSGGDLSHVLNLAGATNSIGTFTTSATSLSTVNYNGTGPTQTVFAANNYRNLIISNSGIKTLQGNSTVGINLTVSGGTFDLGTTTTTLGILGSATINGSLSFNGSSTKTVSLTGNLNGTGSIDMSGGNLSHLLNLNGSTNYIGSYSSGGASTVVYPRPTDQTLFASDDYRNLTVSGAGVKTLLYGDITAKGILTMSVNIDVNGNTLKVANTAIAAIVRTAGTVIGKLQRAVGITGSDYLYPIGSATSYNPLKINFNSSGLTSGPLTAQFKPGYIGTTSGLPLNDADANEIWDTYAAGYWTLNAVSPMATGSFNVNVNHTGFAIDQSAAIVKRTNGGDLELDGSHGAITASEISRTVLVNGISTNTTDIAIGKGRAKINIQPSNIDICEGSNAFFEVKATGRGTLSYQWQVQIGAGPWTNIINAGVYSDADKKKLIITAAPYGMNGYHYRCIITDGSGNTNVTNSVLLTVNLIPIATATPSTQNECPGVPFVTISLGTSNGVTGTTFTWSLSYPAGISTTLLSTGFADGDVINGTFTNTTDHPLTATFMVTPTGPLTTFCVGAAIPVTVTVNPTPKVFILPVSSTQCDNTPTNIRLFSPSTFTDGGIISFNYTVSMTGSVTGFTSPTTGLPDEHHITDILKNNTDVYQIVTYRVVPMSPVGCIPGPAVTTSVTVNPTPRVIPVNPNFKADSSICFGTSTNIILTSPTVMTSGAIIFDYTVSATGGPGIVTGDISYKVNRPLNDPINRQYQDYSDIIQSVYFSVTPKVDNAICVPGNVFVSRIKVHPLPLQDLQMPKTLTCDGGSDATLRAVLSKGTTPINVLWNGPFDYYRNYSTNKDTTDKKNLKGGIYTVTVTDNLGCKNSDNQFVSGARLDSYLFANPKVNGYGTTCPESTDGELWIQETTNSTGIAPFTYTIVYNNLNTVITDTLTTTNVFQKFYNLPSGNYKLFIKDANGCYNTDYPEVNVVAPDVITIEFNKKEYQGGFNISCKGYNDGSVEVKTITGGNGSYTYLWSAASGVPLTVPANGSKLEGIPAGKYYLLTTDMLGCIKTDSVTLTEPAGMQLTASQLSISPDGNFNISCNGGNTGTIKITISGGSGNYTYLWSSPNGFTSTDKDISGLKAGVYTCTVKDLNGCILTPSPSFTLTEPAPLVVTGTLSTSNDGSFNINCNGGTGSINITATGGSTGSYTYIWSTTDGSGIVAGQEDQNALKAGTYHLIVRDANNCETPKDFTLTQPPPFALQLAATNITCQAPGFNNGRIDLTVSGGVAPFNYSWSNGAISEDINTLTQGYYHVTVTYNNTCSKSDSAKINLPPPLTYTTTKSDYNGFNVSCIGLANGSIQVTPTSGLAPFIYTWTGPNGFTATTKDISDLRAGQYRLLITDSNYCTATEIFNLTEPGRLGMTFSLSSSIAGGYNINCAGDSTGFIGIEPLNQVKTVEYLWEDGIFGKTRIDLPAGGYSVIITDANNCHASATIILTEPDSLRLRFDVSQPYCPDKPDGEIRLNVTGGVRGADYFYKWSDNSTNRIVSDIPRGKYMVTVKDMNSCSIKDSVYVESLNESCLRIPNAISPNNDLINDVWNIDMIELYPKMEVLIFNRWGETIWKSEKGYPKPWDGKSNGNELPIDSYHYIIDLHNGTKAIVGNVTIVR